MDIKNFYDKLLFKHKDNPRALGWGSKKTQELRFKILCDIGNLRNKTILDYGCGMGDLYQFLKKYKIREYVGYDINQNMISGAMKKYPKGIFRSYLTIQKFDYILASGVFNLKIRNWKKKTCKTIKELFYLCKKGMAINFLSSLAKKKDKKCYYVEPLEILKFISSLTKKFCLIHNYKDNDCTFYLYK